MRTTRIVVLMGALVTSLSLAASALAGGGSLGSALACKRGGWKTQVSGTGLGFKNQGACVSYFVRSSHSRPSTTSISDDAGSLSDAAKGCKKGGWAKLARVDGSTFKNQGGCVSYVIGGGTPTMNP